MTMPRLWPTVLLHLPEGTTAEAWELFAGLLMEEAPCLGIEELGVTKANAHLPVPPSARLYFPEGSAPPVALLERLAAEVLPAGARVEGEAPLPDQDWGRTWRQYFRTARIGERLYVGPPWEGTLPSDAPANAHLILIDPGQAFGTGSHETTRLAMRLLEAQVPAGAVVLDVGTGSGILCFAALALGARHAIGTENDPVCEENFHLNAGLNHAVGRARFVLAACPEEGARAAVALGDPAPDFLVCNTLSEQFTPMLPALRRLRAPLLLSGFLTSEWDAVRRLVQQAGFRITAEQELDGWGGLAAE